MNTHAVDRSARMARLLERGRKKLDALVPAHDCVAPRDAAERLGMTDAELERACQTGRVLSVALGPDEARIPAWQFDGSSVRTDVLEVAEALAGDGVTPASGRAVLFLSGGSPARHEQLRSGDPGRVLEEAKRAALGHGG